ncbi:hypothetical protein [Devosia sp.]|uniref:hypothetical protein n=1 Tax=Devosia sp. TaxID=1871048 RepID=UPI001AC27499|nr:hypothetical protein [Devosia sp.]MBN9310273.1 hypothetical protein [Devosia sp.]
MPRLATSLIVLAAAAGTAPAAAADWTTASPEGIYRGAYSVDPQDWTELGDDSDGIHMETGLRYWYSMGSMDYASGGSSSSAEDTAHIGEAFLRIEDDATATWAHAMVGYSIAINGTTSGSLASSIEDGQVGYASADFGWNAFDDGAGSGVGGLVGYLYWNNSPDTGRNNFTTATSGSDIDYNPATGQTFVPGDSAPNNVEVHALRLGISGNAKLADFIDVRAELAAVPYAKVNGTVGVDDPEFNTDVYGGAAQFPYGGASGNISQMRSSATSVDGWGYGAMAEAWIGVHPTENITMRLGGRAWYLQGTADASYSVAQISNPGDADSDGTYDTDPTVLNVGAIESNNPFSMFRYGLLAELTYAF